MPATAAIKRMVSASASPATMAIATSAKPRRSCAGGRSSLFHGGYSTVVPEVADLGQPMESSFFSGKGDLRLRRGRECVSAGIAVRGRGDWHENEAGVLHLGNVYGTGRWASGCKQAYTIPEVASINRSCKILILNRQSIFLRMAHQVLLLQCPAEAGTLNSRRDTK